MSRMLIRAADGAVHTGSAVSFVLGIINYFSQSEWIILGVIFGMFCSAFGIALGIYFRCRRERLLRDWIKKRTETIDTEELEMLERE
ncbi:lysis protein [Serratia marcescens]|nr:lysis protein [Serratia marcescens]CAI2077086.1 Uncharacterised protein [Serratia marcescens]CAI2094481.1 Uncharacterised protein [Serratia marcescens]CUZ90833.1 Uncharacterised protein [Serratia marcescens]CVF39507.1 Uncharacterised protein [Serratia marcescens]